MLVPAFSVTDVDNDIKVLSLGANHQAYSQHGQGWGHVEDEDQTQREEDKIPGEHQCER
jgi:hypothetical protein